MLIKCLNRWWKICSLPYVLSANYRIKRFVNDIGYNWWLPPRYFSSSILFPFTSLYIYWITSCKYMHTIPKCILCVLHEMCVHIHATTTKNHLPTYSMKFVMNSIIGIEFNVNTTTAQRTCSLCIYFPETSWIVENNYRKSNKISVKSCNMIVNMLWFCFIRCHGRIDVIYNI